MNNNSQNEFHTLKGYTILSKFGLSESMEDYLEMICRHINDGYMRINVLSNYLNVRPSSASKMVTKLFNYGFVKFEKYGIIILTEKGREAGKYLLWRHNILFEFFEKLNGYTDLKQVEQIEHFISDDTLKNLEMLTPFLKIK